FQDADRREQLLFVGWRQSGRQDDRGLGPAVTARRGGAGRYASLRRPTSVWPARTSEPGVQHTATTTPAAGATIGVSIFIDSITTRRSPAATRAPGGTATSQTLPVTAARTGSAPSGSACSAAGAATLASSGGGGSDAQRSRSSTKAARCCVRNA